MRNIFHEKSYTKCGGETSLRPKNSKLSISLDRQSKVLYSLFLLYGPLAFSSCKVFLKNKKGFGTTLSFSFSA